MSLTKLIDSALKNIKSEIVLKNASYVDVFSGDIKKGDIAISSGKIVGIGENYSGETEYDVRGRYVIPGLIDGHIHIESTMMTPSNLAKTIVPLGTTTIIADPHEIANVCGMGGIEYIANESENLPLDVKIMLPSCVPATPFENSGAILSSKEIKENIGNKYIHGLGEFMNFPGVLFKDEDVIKKLVCAIEKDVIIDGHAPGLTAEKLNAYLVSGVKTDHECTNIEEMHEKISKGMYVLIREGSATRNAEVLAKGITSFNMRRCVLCTDDRHSSDLISKGHLDNNLRVLVKSGVPAVTAVIMATLNAAECYRLKNKGAIAPSFIADLVVMDNLTDFNAEMVFVKGKLVAKNKKALFSSENKLTEKVLNTVHVANFEKDCFDIKLKGNKARIIKLVPKNVVTTQSIQEIKTVNGLAYIKGTDLNKLAVVERHKLTGNIGLGLIEGYGIENGALATTVSHDSHNIIIIGDNNEDMLIALKELEKIGGGMVVVKNGKVIGELKLEVAGLISTLPVEELAKKSQELIDLSHLIGVSKEVEAFMSLSFLSLVVIPELKITDRGLFELAKFDFVDING